MLEIIIFLIFLSLMLFLYPVLNMLMGKQKPISRLKKYINIEEIHEHKKKTTQKEFKIGLGLISKRVENARFMDGYRQAIQLQLTKAHILLKAEEYIAVCIILFISFGFITLLITITQPPLISILFTVGSAIIGWLIPSFIVRSKIKRRLKQLNDQLCDAIVLISNSLKAGYSFFQSIDTVSREMIGPISEEFAILQKEINFGITTEKALENLVYRCSSDDLGLVVTAVQIQRQVGGNLSEILDNISSTIRQRIKIKGEVRTLTAQGRMSGLIISLLPLVLGLILFIINPAHIMKLFNNPIGLAILGFSALMELIGIYFIKQIVKVEI